MTTQGTTSGAAGPSTRAGGEVCTDRPAPGAATAVGVSWWIWRHPRPEAVRGRCIGQHDVGVDRRRAKRLARRIQRVTRREGLPREVWTSSLQRAHAVGAFLARWGWRHRVDERLREADFGSWDGRPWQDIGQQDIDAWCADFAHHAPGGGESLATLFARCGAALRTLPRDGARPVCVVGHAGWISAARHLVQGLPVPTRAADWPAPVPYGSLLVLASSARTEAPNED